MNANKVTVKIEMEALHIDVLRGMLSQVTEQVEAGAESGHLEMDDGDFIQWETSRTPVRF